MGPHGWGHGKQPGCLAKKLSICDTYGVSRLYLRVWAGVPGNRKTQFWLREPLQSRKIPKMEQFVKTVGKDAFL